MKRGDTFEEFEKLNGVSMDDVVAMFDAILEAFPMILLVNLSKDTYIMLKEDGFLADELPKQGVYDDVMDYAGLNVHANYQTVLYESFSRENLLKMFQQGKPRPTRSFIRRGGGISISGWRFMCSA